ncbi:hypothetical protein M8J76_016054 [Diaphorina citri]|nr:hypothetical protein M8J76_016054 [Diaphorina citri]
MKDEAVTTLKPRFSRRSTSTYLPMWRNIFISQRSNEILQDPNPKPENTWTRRADGPMDRGLYEWAQSTVNLFNGKRTIEELQDNDLVHLVYPRGPGGEGGLPIKMSADPPLSTEV